MLQANVKSVYQESFKSLIHLLFIHVNFVQLVGSLLLKMNLAHLATQVNTNNKMPKNPYHASSAHLVLSFNQKILLVKNVKKADIKMIRKSRMQSVHFVKKGDTWIKQVVSMKYPKLVMGRK